MDDYSDASDPQLSGSSLHKYGIDTSRVGLERTFDELICHRSPESLISIGLASDFARNNNVPSVHASAEKHLQGTHTVSTM